MAKRYLVYFWTTEDNQFVKIGHCQSNLYQRRRAIKTGCPLLICEYPIGVIVCENATEMRKVEKALQKKFKTHRTQGEWFNLTDEIYAYIQEFSDTESGERFIEEGRECDKASDEKRRESPEYKKRKESSENRERSQKYQHEYYKERYQNDPEYRERKLANCRGRYQNDPEYQESNKKYQRERYQNDPEYRERKRELSREYRRRKKRKDPEFMKRERERNRKYYAHKKAERLAEKGQSNKSKQLQLPIDNPTKED